MSVDEVLDFYNRLPQIYAPNDRWLSVSHRWIGDFVRSELLREGDLSPLGCVNLGSGGVAYGVPEPAVVHVDIHPLRLRDRRTAVLADIQRSLPFGPTFRVCLCVGSVLNHCDAAALLSSAAGAMAEGGLFILEFETSHSLELLFSRHFGRSASVVETFYQDRTIRLWAYAERYVRELLRANGFSVERRSSRHHLSPLIYLVARDSNIAARFAFLDRVARRLPLLRNSASHVIFACRKRG